MLCLKNEFYCLIYKPKLHSEQVTLHSFWPILSAILFTVNSEIFARVIFSRNFAYAKFRENKALARWQINLSFTDICISCQSWEFLTLQICLLMLFTKISKFTVCLQCKPFFIPCQEGYKLFSCSTELSRIFQFIPCQEG